MKFKDFQAPVLFSSTFKALNLGEKNSSTFKDAWESCIRVHCNLLLMDKIKQSATVMIILSALRRQFQVTAYSVNFSEL